MGETFFILSFKPVSFEINKSFYQNKFCYKLFLPPKLKNEILFFVKVNFEGKNNLSQILFW